jgi:hypothetical protein
VTVTGLLFAGLSWFMQWDSMVTAIGVCTALGAVIGYFTTGNIRAEQQEQERLAAMQQADLNQPPPRTHRRSAPPPQADPSPSDVQVGFTEDPTHRPDVILALMDSEMRKYAGTEFPPRWLKTRSLLEAVPASNNVWKTLREIALIRDVKLQAQKIQAFLDAFDKIMSKRGQ